jgi:GWxTD domain-containing protein
MKKKGLTALLIAVSVLLGAAATSNSPLLAKKKSTRLKIKELDRKYKDWLNMVGYIITNTEKQVFFKLKNNRERDSFISMFWNLRDPSKGTPDNEYRDEHMKRFNYASRYFKYGSPLPGWKTDRGRMWILLGEPIHRNVIDSSNELYPVEIWEYFGGPKLGLPTVFRVVFYKRSGAGDYRLYIPSADGPSSLLRVGIGTIDITDHRAVYYAINEAEPQVAEIALSLVPGESLVNFSPSLQAPILISKIYDLPKKRINASYARNFLNYKGMVDTRVVTNYINIKSDIYILRDPILKLNFVHFALLPDQISVDYVAENDKYYFNFDLMVFLKKGEDTIFQYTKKYPFYYDKDELESRISHGIIITDYFPVIDGDYKLIALLQNSLNKELSYYETRIKVRTPGSKPAGAGPQLYGPLVSYRINQSQRPVYAAFNLLENNIKIDPKKAFGLNDTLQTFFSVDKGDYNGVLKVELDVRSMDDISTSTARKYGKTYSFTIPELDRFKNVIQRLEKLAYGNYEMKARLLDAAGKLLMERENKFQVSPKSIVPHPPLASKTLKKEHHFLFYMMMGQQYQNSKALTTAEAYFEKAFRMNSRFPQLLKSYASLLFSVKKYDKVLAVIKNLENQEKEAFDYYSYKGRALYYLGKYEDAVDTLLKANKIYDSDTGVLNTLGLSLVRLGNNVEAEKALSASLKINDTQKDIARVLRRLKTNKTRQNK